LAESGAKPSGIVEALAGVLRISRPGLELLASGVRGMEDENQNDGRKQTMNGALSAAGLRQMHDVISGYVTRGEVPGLVTLIARGDAAHADALGASAIAGTDSHPVRRDTIFRIASMTKAITAVATMILVEDGKLKLDDPVDPVLPELANRNVLKRVGGPLEDVVPAKRPITVRDLLTFRWGNEGHEFQRSRR
jgi:CubicO group peptidase (beta-lactamase class C family)